MCHHQIWSARCVLRRGRLEGMGRFHAARADTIDGMQGPVLIESQVHAGASINDTAGNLRVCQQPAASLPGP